MAPNSQQAISKRELLSSLCAVLLLRYFQYLLFLQRQSSFPQPEFQCVFPSAMVLFLRTQQLLPPAPMVSTALSQNVSLRARGRRPVGV